MLSKFDVSGRPRHPAITRRIGKILLAIGNRSAVSIDVQNVKIKHLFKAEAPSKYSDPMFHPMASFLPQLRAIIAQYLEY